MIKILKVISCSNSSNEFYLECKMSDHSTWYYYFVENKWIKIIPSIKELQEKFNKHIKQL